ncbi:Uncharacterised protein [Pseudomonas aeruginosa]|jgi:predicted DNA-binding transcriptional regulator AlpA|uniref:helix-turn-helix transcriptional regulator n=1 Tax=Pseudomonadaceae TaxID=135621 RepID=UPI0010CBC8F9|nr:MULTISPECIES: helix-turn-helix domain-containing protein [Pseudomonadaceae]UFM87547.1 helix-turn-helix domain-containing protein [Pseudomonas aeruginosa]UFM96195.1 helix-turn-helix domain-containing protein [Pseudomonas aeruginosa]CAB5724735.1 Uncharacterised protein [Pseudomonas aeruginosa]
MPKQFFTNTEASEILRCSKSTLLRRRRAKRHFPQPLRVGQRLLWSPEQLVQAMILLN